MLKKSTLLTPDPYHTPGYCGYVPQFKYHVGATFGSHTHNLLTSTDTEVARSGNPVLTDNLPSTDFPPKTAEDFFGSPVYKSRNRSWGDQKYVPQMVPGYTGYIPSSLHHFGCRYAETCHYAISGFEQDQRKHQALADEMRSYKTEKGSSLKLTNLKPKPYLSAYAKQHSVPSQYMPDDHPQKCYKSGYTGFVPKARKYLGQSYALITHSALQENAAEKKRLLQSWNEPIQVFRSEQKERTFTGLYPKDTGLVPHYTGHIPGEKFHYGSTFGTSTRDAVPELSV